MPHKPLRVVVQEQASLIAALRAANQDKDEAYAALKQAYMERVQAFETLEYALAVLEQLSMLRQGYTHDGMRLQ